MRRPRTAATLPLRAAIGIGASFEQRVHDCGISGCAREVKRSDLQIRGRVDVRAGSQQQIDNLRVFFVRGPVECRGTVDLGRVDVNVLPQERAHRGLVVVFDGVHERSRQ